MIIYLSSRLYHLLFFMRMMMRSLQPLKARPSIITPSTNNKKCFLLSYGSESTTFWLYLSSLCTSISLSTTDLMYHLSSSFLNLSTIFSGSFLTFLACLHLRLLLSFILDYNDKHINFYILITIII